MAGAAERSVIASWTDRPARALLQDQNALTIDVEDYFQVEALAGRVAPDRWDGMECRIERNVNRILDMLDQANVKATFFTLGWIAQRYRALVRQIVGRGHELASHGHAHLRADRISPEQFRDDIGSAKSLLEDVSGEEVRGYRAPCFSISRNNLWAMEAVRDAGYRYSSSIYPIHHDAYGIPDAPLHAFHPFAGGEFTEIPVSAVRVMGINLPCGGGGYFRLMPLSLSLAGLGRISGGEKRPCIFYFHPWEIDPGQPRIGPLPFKSAFRHYTNLGRMERRLSVLLGRFSWNRIDRIFPVARS